VILRSTANLNSSLFQHALDDLVGLRWVGLTDDVCIWPAAQGDGENAADGTVGRPHDPKFGMGLGIEGSSIAETAEGEPVGMWPVAHGWDSTAIFVHDAKGLDL